MNVLITGGAGFIGSHLAERLLSQGHRVFIIDDLSTGSIHNILHLKGNADFTYAIDTITNVPLLAELVDRVDLVYHLAAAVGVSLIVEEPVRTIETNVRGTEVLLHLANKKKKPVVITSTSEVYGKGVQVPFREDGDLTLGPSSKARWSYACSKLLDEFLAMAYWRDRRLPVIVVRLFNTVGPRQSGHYGMVIPRFVSQALAGKPITVYGTGDQTRCFCDVRDVVWALTELVRRDEAFGEVFNIGSTTEISIGALARMVRAQAGSPSQIVFVPYEEAYAEGFEDMLHRVPDITKIRSVIGFEPKVDLPAILDRVIAFHRERLDAKKSHTSRFESGYERRYGHDTAARHGL